MKIPGSFTVMILATLILLVLLVAFTAASSGQNVLWKPFLLLVELFFISQHLAMQLDHLVIDGKLPTVFVVDLMIRLFILVRITHGISNCAGIGVISYRCVLADVNQILFVAGEGHTRQPVL